MNLAGRKPETLAAGWYPEEFSGPAEQLVKDIYGETGDNGKNPCCRMHNIDPKDVVTQIGKARPILVECEDSSAKLPLR